MAAYAALVSVMHIIETLQNHPRPPISIDKEQLQSLTQKITFLQEFLETHSIDDGFEGRIADAAYAAEDVIESHIVDQINATTNTHKETTSYVDVLYNGLYKVIRDLDLIQGDAHNFTKKAGIKVGDDDQLLHNNYSMPGGGGGGGGSLRRSHFSSTLGQDDAVGLDDILVKVMDKLTCGGHRSNRQIIPIVGMGGIGSKLQLHVGGVRFICFPHQSRIPAVANSANTEIAKPPGVSLIVFMYICNSSNSPQIAHSGVSFSEEECRSVYHARCFNEKHYLSYEIIALSNVQTDLFAFLMYGYE